MTVCADCSLQRAHSRIFTEDYFEKLVGRKISSANFQTFENKNNHAINRSSINCQCFFIEFCLTILVISGLSVLSPY